jgi:hypothetical protein
LQNYCREHELDWTRSRAYRKNDQAWVEQKNGAVGAAAGRAPPRRLAAFTKAPGCT